MLPGPDAFEITPAELSALRDAEDAPPFRLVDCREEDEYAFCRIEGAHLLPLSRFAHEAPAALDGDPPHPAVVYCHHGVRSMRATVFLRDRGIPAWSLAGGIEAWSTQVDPTVPRY